MAERCRPSGRPPLLRNISAGRGRRRGREFSKSTAIPKKLLRVRDHGFDGYMEVQKKVRRALKLQELILSHPGGAAPVSQLDALARRHAAFGPFEAGSFLLKHPHVFHIYEHPVQRVLWVRLTPRAARQLHEEATAVQEMLPDATLRLRKLLLLSNSGRLRLEHVRVARRDLGLPDDFEYSVVLANPASSASSAATGGAPSTSRRRRRKGTARTMSCESARSNGAGRGVPGKGGRRRGHEVLLPGEVPAWFQDRQVLPHRHVEVAAGALLVSLRGRIGVRPQVHGGAEEDGEAAVATIHELLSLTVEKKTTLERIAHFRQAMDLPMKLKEEAYCKGEMVEPNPVHLARRKLAELLLTSPKDVNLDRMLTSLGGLGRRGADGWDGMPSERLPWGERGGRWV
ncbi:unnamed protein product [Spirodela intermedia]|uniref:PORR domain-containing protein n=1 Tax=Spirodela intermedia TaxID=51605 RepID=A0A7I8IG11_SPIIN|nr:unnamed protein product [Spirodela intermedia]CAA6656325.1 unnamed protein product [Spirodela intermedia]